MEEEVSAPEDVVPPTAVNPDKAAPKRHGSFPVVAVGASAGGTEAYTEFFRALPGHTGMAFVVAQHLDPNHQSMLSELIAKTTKLPVDEVKEGASLEPDHVYVIPPNAFMTIAEASSRSRRVPRSRDSTSPSTISCALLLKTAAIVPSA